MQTLSSREYQPHALGMQAALDWLSTPSAFRHPTNPYKLGTREAEEWCSAFYREEADFLAVVHLL